MAITSETIGIADALKTAAAAKVTGLSFSVVPTPYLYSDEADSTKRVFIVPVEIPVNIQDARNTIKREFNYKMIYRVLCEETANAIDPHVKYVEDLLDWLTIALTVTFNKKEYSVIRVGSMPIYNHEKLHEQKIFESIIDVNFKIIRTA
jgi:hypothetical protein